MPQNGVGRLLLDSLGVEQFKPEGLFSWWVGGDFPADATDCCAIDVLYLKNPKKGGHIGLQLLFPSRTKQFRENVPVLEEAGALRGLLI